METADYGVMVEGVAAMRLMRVREEKYWRDAHT